MSSFNLAVDHTPPLIIAHRGASLHAPENTLAALLKVMSGSKKKLKRMVFSWVVNDPQDILRVRDWGLEGIITDAPEVVRKTLER